MFGLRKYIQTEIQKYIESQIQYLSFNTYDEHGKQISSSFYYKVDDGHWVNVRTNSNFDVFSEHIRTEKNWKSIQKNGKNRETLDTQYDQEHVFKKRFDDRFDKDIVERTNAGIFVVKK